MAKIQLKNLKKVFKGNVVAVNNVNIIIEEGIVTSILGPSGCGKTTTMRLIAGFENPTEGEIFFDGQKVNNLGPFERKVGMVFQLPILYDDLSIQENISMPLILLKKTQHEINKKVGEMCDFFDIPENLLKRKARGLDVAERQKVSLAHTFISDKNVYLLDEPLSNLDPRNRIEIRSKIKRYQNEARKTIVYVTHDQTEAMSLAQKIAVMQLGVILHYDKTEIVYDYPQNRFVGWFLGNPGMNFIEKVIWEKEKTTLQVGHLQMEFQSIDDERKGHQEVVLGIRPENILISTQPKEGYFEAQSDFIEPIGNRIVVHLVARDIKVKAKIEKIKDIKKDSKIWVKFPADRILLFDPKSGEKIYPMN